MRDVYVGGASRAISALNKLAPRLVDWFSERVISRQHFRDEPARHKAGALYKPGEDGHVQGDQPGHVFERSLYTRGVTHPVAASLLLAAAGAAMAKAVYSHRTTEAGSPWPADMHRA